MNSRQFILNFLDGKIQRTQPIGIVGVKNEYPKEFAAGYFIRGIFPFNNYTLGLNLGSRSRYTASEDKIDTHFGTWYVDDENETIFTNKKRFEETMESLMTKVKTKDNFPLFVRDLSKLDGWK